MRSTRSVPVVLTFLLAIGAATSSAAADPAARVAPTPNLAVTPALVDRAKVHTFRPAQVVGVALQEEVKQLNGASLIAKKNVGRVLPAKPTVNATKVGDDLKAALKDNVRGYAFEIRKHGTPVYSAVYEWSRSPAQGNKNWTLDTKMHVASVSKVITTVTAVKMLDERGLPFDTKIGPYLPSYWTLGPNTADITFKQLLTHRAGFDAAHHGGDYATFKSQIAQGVFNHDYTYTNGAFSIVRVLNATMTNAVPKNTVLPNIVPKTNWDAVWDILTTDAFEQYVKTKVFEPAGVTGVSPVPTTSTALAYTSKQYASGWDSGDLSTELGGAGFRVSVHDVLDVMGTFRRKGTIVSRAKAQEALDAGLGIDVTDETPAGKMYLKNGWWGGGGQDANAEWHVEQAVAAYLPDEMELVVLVNSNVGVPAASLTQTVRTAVANNVE